MYKLHCLSSAACRSQDCKCGRERIQFLIMQAVSTEIIIYRLDFYYQDINYNYICICNIYNKHCNQYDVCLIGLKGTL